MAWQKLFETCPKCGETLYADTATGEVACLECDYETGYKMPEAVIGDEQ